MFSQLFSVSLIPSRILQKSLLSVLSPNWIVYHSHTLSSALVSLNITSISPSPSNNGSSKRTSSIRLALLFSRLYPNSPFLLLLLLLLPLPLLIHPLTLLLPLLLLLLLLQILLRLHPQLTPPHPPPPLHPLLHLTLHLLPPPSPLPAPPLLPHHQLFLSPSTIHSSVHTISCLFAHPHLLHSVNPFNSLPSLFLFLHHLTHNHALSNTLHSLSLLLLLDTFSRFTIRFPFLSTSSSFNYIGLLSLSFKQLSSSSSKSSSQRIVCSSLQHSYSSSFLFSAFLSFFHPISLLFHSLFHSVP